MTSHSGATLKRRVETNLLTFYLHNYKAVKTPFVCPSNIQVLVAPTTKRLKQSMPVSTYLTNIILQWSFYYSPFTNTTIQPKKKKGRAEEQKQAKFHQLSNSLTIPKIKKQNYPSSIQRESIHTLFKSLQSNNPVTFTTRRAKEQPSYQNKSPKQKIYKLKRGNPTSLIDQNKNPKLTISTKFNKIKDTHTAGERERETLTRP